MSRANEYSEVAYAASIFEFIKIEDEFSEGFKKPALKRLRMVIPYLYLNVGFEPKQIHSRTLRSIFGKEAVGTSLAKSLLLVENNTWSYGDGQAYCKSYSTNKRNFNKVLDMMGASVDHIESAVVKFLYNQYKDEFDSGQFDMRKIGFREYHDITCLTSELRDRLFAYAGYDYEYDISACAPSIIVGLAKKNGIKTRYNTLESFAANPKKWRNELAESLSTTNLFVKKFVNAVIHGARLNRRSGVIKELCDSFNVDIVKLAIRTLKFRQEFSRVINSLIKIGELVRPNDIDKDIKLNRGQKVHYMFTRYEEKIRTIWTEFFNVRGFKIHNVHDGFYLTGDGTKLMNELSSVISTTIGFSVKIEGDKLNTKEIIDDELVDNFVIGLTEIKTKID